MKLTFLLPALFCALTLAADHAAIVPQAAANPQSTVIGLRSPVIGGAEAITIPQMLSYQGKLTDTLGVPVADTLYAIRFRFYAVPSGGTQFWEETQDVRTKGGLFSVLLGSVTPIGTVPDAGTLYLGMAVGGDTANYALAGAGGGDNAWVRGTPDSVLYTVRRLGVARGAASNMLYGTYRQSHTNLGVSCTTGTSGLDNANIVVAGGFGNRARAALSSIGGGTLNLAAGAGGTVAGGAGNVAGDSVTDTCATVAGGYGNFATGMFATVGGGQNDTASGPHATVSGGMRNRASGGSATVGGGSVNRSGGGYATVAGGTNNEASGDQATVGGGGINVASEYAATVSGGNNNDATGQYSTVGGGQYNLAAGSNAAVGGGAGNAASGRFATVAGGHANTAGDAAGDTAAVVCGGSGNRAIGVFSFVGGGQSDTASGNWSTVGGGRNHAASGMCGTIAGGGSNRASGDYATVGGGAANEVSSNYAVVAGGWGNLVSGIAASIAGGSGNTAAGVAGAIAGGGQNRASGDYAAVPGGYYNAARGGASLAAGRYARANHRGSFVWSDSAASASESVYTTGNNQFRARARGGTWFFSNAGMTTGAYLAPGSNSWESACDSMTKEDFRPVDRKALLDKVAALRVRDYKMKDQDDGTRHIGPVAQDFHNVFGYGGNETSINLADADGVALAAIQALYEQSQTLYARVDAQQAEIEALKVELKRR